MIKKHPLLLLSGSTLTSLLVTLLDLDRAKAFGLGLPTLAVALDFFWKLILDQEVRWVVMILSLSLCFGLRQFNAVSYLK